MPSFEEQYQARGLASQRRYPNEALLAFLAAHYFVLPIELRNTVKILELGCGSGANLWMLAHEGFSAHGIDFAPTGLAYCHEVLKQWNVSAELMLGDMTALPYTANSFDAVVDVVSLQHLNYLQHEQTFTEAWRVLKPGGRFFSCHLGSGSSAFSAPEAMMLDEITLSDIPSGYPLAGNGQTAFLNPDQFRSMVGAAGFIDVSIEHQLRSYSSLQCQVEYLLLSAKKP